ncbi:hypothetical protein GCM10027174_19710 [Salinifilum aidingensis]
MFGALPFGVGDRFAGLGAGVEVLAVARSGVRPCERGVFGQAATTIPVPAPAASWCSPGRPGTHPQLPPAVGAPMMWPRRTRERGAFMGEQAPSTSNQATRGSTDRVVFGVAAVLVLFFLGWGIASPASLGAFAEAGLGWPSTTSGGDSRWPPPGSWCSSAGWR